MDNKILVTIIFSCCFYFVKSDAVKCNKMLKTGGTLGEINVFRYQFRKEKSNYCSNANRWSFVFTDFFPSICIKYLISRLEKSGLISTTEHFCGVNIIPYTDFRNCESVDNMQNCISSKMAMTLAKRWERKVTGNECALCNESPFLVMCACESKLHEKCPKVFDAMLDGEYGWQKLMCERCRKAKKTQSEMPSYPRMSLIGSDSCSGTTEECDDCQKRSKELPARKVGESIQIQCINTVPTNGSQLFQWFYRDKHGEYHNITENVTDVRCPESRVLFSRLDFTPNSFQHYGTNLILRCNTTYYSKSDIVEEIKKSSEIKICLIYKQTLQPRTETVSALTETVLKASVGTTPGKGKKIASGTGFSRTIIVVVVTVSISIVIVLVGVTYYRYKRAVMNRELDTIKGSKTSNAADISFTSLKSGDLSSSTAWSKQSKNSRRKRRRGKKQSTR